MAAVFFTLICKSGAFAIKPGPRSDKLRCSHCSEMNLHNYKENLLRFLPANSTLRPTAKLSVRYAKLILIICRSKPGKRLMI